jgi:hypothetical protein
MNRSCLLLLAACVMAASPAAADCRDDLIKADQNLNRTRSELHKATSAAPAVKCGAYRRHVASLTEVRNVFARCDTSSAKAANASQVGASLAEFSKQMRASCAGAGKK